MKKQTIISTSTASLVALCWPLHVHMEQVVAFSPSTFSPVMRTSSLPLHALNRNNEREMPMSRPFSDSTSPVMKTSNRDLSIRSYADPDSTTAQEPATAASGSTSTEDEETKNLLLEQDQEALNSWSAKMSEMSGSFDEERLVFPEIASGEVNRVFRYVSSFDYYVPLTSLRWNRMRVDPYIDLIQNLQYAVQFTSTFNMF